MGKAARGWAAVEQVTAGPGSAGEGRAMVGEGSGVVGSVARGLAAAGPGSEVPGWAVEGRGLVVWGWAAGKGSVARAAAESVMQGWAVAMRPGWEEAEA